MPKSEDPNLEIRPLTFIMKAVVYKGEWNKNTNKRGGRGMLLVRTTSKTMCLYDILEGRKY
jgi:hypothetical protein